MARALNRLKIGMLDHQHTKHLIFPFMKLRLMVSVSVEKITVNDKHSLSVSVERNAMNKT